MPLHSVMMKNFYIWLIVCWFSVINGKAIGNVIPQDPRILVKSDGNIADVYKDSGNGSSWLQMLLVFARDSPNSQPHLQLQNAPCSGSGAVPTEPNVETRVCQEGFVMLESGKCYFFSFKRKKWHEAQAICESVGTTLAYPMNVIENTVLGSYLKYNFNGLEGWWLGGNDLVSAKNWVWAHNKAPIVYNDWTPGQPSHGERCLQFWLDKYEWNNIDCNGLYPFVCQQL